jgi:hypothetical protein
MFLVVGGYSLTGTQVVGAAFFIGYIYKENIIFVKLHR